MCNFQLAIHVLLFERESRISKTKRQLSNIERNQSDERFRKVQEARLLEKKTEMIRMIAEAEPTAIHIKNKRGDSPLGSSVGPIADVMKRCETPELSELEYVRKELAQLKLELKAKDDRIRALLEAQLG